MKDQTGACETRLPESRPGMELPAAGHSEVGEMKDMQSLVRACSLDLRGRMEKRSTAVAIGPGYLMYWRR